MVDQYTRKSRECVVVEAIFTNKTSLILSNCIKRILFQLLVQNLLLQRK